MQFRRVIVVPLLACALAACGGGDDGARTTAAAVETPMSTPTATPAAPVSTPTPAAAAATPTAAAPTPSPVAEQATPARAKAPRGADDATHGTLTLTATDLAFSSKVVDARRGKLNVVLENAGGTAHDVVFAPAGGAKPVAALPLTEPGMRTEQTIRLRPGRYVFYCDVPGHAEEGMRGRLRVS